MGNGDDRDRPTQLQEDERVGEALQPRPPQLGVRSRKLHPSEAARHSPDSFNRLFDRIYRIYEARGSAGGPGFMPAPNVSPLAPQRRTRLTSFLQFGAQLLDGLIGGNDFGRPICNGVDAPV